MTDRGYPRGPGTATWVICNGFEVSCELPTIRPRARVERVVARYEPLQEQGVRSVAAFGCSDGLPCHGKG